MDIRFEKASSKYAVSFCSAVDAVARERKYLAGTTGFPEDITREFVRNIEKNNLAQFYAWALFVYFRKCCSSRLAT